MLGLGQPHRVQSSLESDPLFVAHDYYDQQLVGFDLEGEVKFRAPADGYLQDLAYQPQADRICYRLNDTIEVVEARTGKKVARIKPEGIEFTSVLVALPDGRFAVNTRDEKNTGVITTFDPTDPSRLTSADIDSLPLEMTASDGGLLVAERTQNLAVVDGDKVLYQSDRVTSGRHLEADGKIWCLEARPNFYKHDHGVLVGIDGRTGAVEEHPFPGRAHRLMDNGKGQFLVQESWQGDKMSFKWLEPGQKAGELFQVEGNTVEEMHLGDDGAIYVLSDDYAQGGQWVYRCRHGHEPEMIHHVEKETWMTISPTDQGLLAFTRKGVTNVDTGVHYQNLTELVEQAGIPRVTGRQHDNSSTTTLKPRGDEVSSLFEHVIRWDPQPNPLVNQTPEGLAVRVSGGLNLALVGSDLPAVVEQMVQQTAELRQELLTPSKQLPVDGTALTYPGLGGWSLVSDGAQVSVNAPQGQEARHPIKGEEGSVITTLKALEMEGEAFVAAGFSDGSFVWSSTRKEGIHQRLDLGSPASEVVPKDGGLLISCLDGSLHFIENGRTREVEHIDLSPEIEFEEDTLIIGGVELTIEHS